MRGCIEGEGGGACEGEERRLLTFGRAMVSQVDAGIDRDLVVSMYISSLLCPEWFCVSSSSSSSSSLLLFKDDTRGGGISFISITVSCFLLLLNLSFFHLLLLL